MKLLRIEFLICIISTILLTSYSFRSVPHAGGRLHGWLSQMAVPRHDHRVELKSTPRRRPSPSLQLRALPEPLKAGSGDRIADADGKSSDGTDPLQRITFNDVFSPRGADFASISRVLIGESLVLTIGSIFCSVIGFNPLLQPTPCSFDADSMLLALKFAVPLSGERTAIDDNSFIVILRDEGDGDDFN